MLETFALLADYNAWANGRLYEAVAALSETDYRADHGAFFRSLEGTLNHLVVTDRIWLARFQGEEGPRVPLDGIVCPTFDALRAARAAEDARLIAFVAGLDADAIAGTIRYRTISAPMIIEQRLGDTITHLFNHQTHHRGQAHALLTRITGEAPSLDLLMFQRLTGRGVRVEPVPA